MASNLLDQFSTAFYLFSQGYHVRVKNEYDRQGLLAIGKIVATVLDDLRQAVKPGLTTSWLDSLAATLLARHGARATPQREYAFPGRLCISINNEVVHGIPGDRVIQQGDLVKLDLTADKAGYVADATRMAVIPPANDLAQRLADSARRACQAAIRIAHDGTTLRELGGAVEAEVRRDGFRVVRCLCGHGVGRHTHEEPEVPNYPDRHNAVVLKRGMVITIEPILSAGSGEVRETADGWTIVTTDNALASHYEETVIVGENAAETITVM